MIQSKEKLKSLAITLNNKNNKPALLAVEMLRKEEPFEGAIEVLVSCYDNNKDIELRKTIESFLNDLKDMSLREEIISEIRKNRENETKKMLVASCWQSGLDYSRFVHEFADIFITNDYQTALECFTVIEEAIPRMNRNEKENVIKILKKNSSIDSSEKKQLAEQLITVLNI
jgi:predicted DNA-binding protein